MFGKDFPMTSPLLEENMNLNKKESNLEKVPRESVSTNTKMQNIAE